MQAAETMRKAMDQALSARQGAAVWMDVLSGHIEEHRGDLQAEALPGSTLKPILLLAALRAHLVSPEQTVICSGVTLVAGHNLACTHPHDRTVLDARSALAESCNAYFAEVARHMSAELIAKTLRHAGLPLAAPARTPDERVLITLGLADVRVSPATLAHAYRVLAEEITAAPASGGVVRDGLRASVQTGMAHAALTTGIRLEGKTGSAHDSSPAGQHGWFAGLVYPDTALPAESAVHVLVVYLPGGNGNDAAAVAHAILAKAH